ncbi:pcd6 interacting protein-related [Anaeramoeba ignava]|uniref:Pcd6 interacting protein-related n=1 Tax=Anaeramoeba ignava TaxID=1746090 RepID=A0A9Q0RAQ8_ANAIG|nr:pcd6 interacting protein-related [Anaeramoeba ignava]
MLTIRPSLIIIPSKKSKSPKIAKKLSNFFTEKKLGDVKQFSNSFQKIEELAKKSREITSYKSNDIIFEYVGYLNLLQNKLLHPRYGGAEKIKIKWKWNSSFANSTYSSPDFEFEKASILFNYASILSQAPMTLSYSDVAELKEIMRIFSQASKWFLFVKEITKKLPESTFDLSPEFLDFCSTIMLAQGEEAMFSWSKRTGKFKSTPTVLSQICELYKKAMRYVTASFSKKLPTEFWDHIQSKLLFWDILMNLDYSTDSTHKKKTIKNEEKISRLRYATSRLKEFKKIKSNFTELNEAMKDIEPRLTNMLEKEEKEAKFMLTEIPSYKNLKAIPPNQLITQPSKDVIFSEYIKNEPLVNLVPIFVMKSIKKYFDSLEKQIQMIEQKYNNLEKNIQEFINNSLFQEISIISNSVPFMKDIISKNGMEQINKLFQYQNQLREKMHSQYFQVQKELKQSEFFSFVQKFGNFLTQATNSDQKLDIFFKAHQQKFDQVLTIESYFFDSNTISDIEEFQKLSENIQENSEIQNIIQEIKTKKESDEVFEFVNSIEDLSQFDPQLDQRKNSIYSSLFSDLETQIKKKNKDLNLSQQTAKKIQSIYSSNSVDNLPQMVKLIQLFVMKLQESISFYSSFQKSFSIFYEQLNQKKK